MNGIVLFDTSTMRIDRADLALSVRSESFENEVFPFLRNLLPLRREAPGNWRLFREREAAS
jgi:hypothetical protein